MIFFLFVLLILLLLFTAILNKFDIMCPDIWVVSGYVIGAAGSALNYKIWGDISGITVFVVIITIITFLQGSAVGKHLRLQPIKQKKFQFSIPETNRHLSKSIVIIMNVVMFIVALFYLLYMYENSILGGNTGGWKQMFSYARLALSSNNFLKMGFGLSFLIKFSFGFAYVQTYIVIQDIIYTGRKSVRLFDVLSIILYLIHSILSGGRTKMLYFVVFITTVAIILFRNKNNWDKSSRRAGLKYILFGIVFGLSFFWIIDKTVRGSVYGSTFTMWNQFSKYISSPINALDVYLKAPSRMEFFVETETLYPLISILNKMGANIPFFNNALEFVSFGKTTTVITNIYTASRRYIHDFGYIGLITIMFFQGVIYRSWYETIKSRRIQGLKLLFYGVLVYPVAFYFIEERFLNDLFTLTMIFQLLCMVLFWKLTKISKKEQFQEI